MKESILRMHRTSLDEKMPASSPGRNNVSPCPVLYLAADLKRCRSHAFYTGFSKQIVGIFVSTYTDCPVGTQAALKIRFPGGEQKTAAGVVEWTRAFHPLNMETEPGLGIRFVQKNEDLKLLLERYASQIPCLFFDTDDIITENRITGETVHEDLPERDPIYLRSAPDLCDETIPPGADTANFSGLLRDVAAYLEQKASEHRSNTKSSRRSDVISTSTTLTARAVSDVRTAAQFHGGFTNEDEGKKMFVITNVHCPKGTLVTLKILLPDGDVFTATGEVRWVRKRNPTVQNQAAPPGLGIRIDNVPENKWRLAQTLTFTDSSVLLCEETGVYS